MFDLVAFWKRFFGGARPETRSIARDRLRLVLVSDRSALPPSAMEEMRQEIIQVISRYMDIDTCSMQIGLERTGEGMALAANIPVRAVRRSSQELSAVRLSERERAKLAERKATPEPLSGAGSVRVLAETGVVAGPVAGVGEPLPVAVVAPLPVAAPVPGVGGQGAVAGPVAGVATLGSAEGGQGAVVDPAVAVTAVVAPEEKTALGKTLSANALATGGQECSVAGHTVSGGSAETGQAAATEGEATAEASADVAASAKTEKASSASPVSSVKPASPVSPGSNVKPAGNSTLAASGKRNKRSRRRKN